MTDEWLIKNQPSKIQLKAPEQIPPDYPRSYHVS